MDKFKNKFREIRWHSVFVTIDYLVVVYILCVSFWQILKLAGVAGTAPDMWDLLVQGSVRISLLLLQYNFIKINQDESILAKIRPFVTGALIANILATGILPLNLLLFVVIGFFLYMGYASKFNVGEMLTVALVAVISLKVYSVCTMLNSAVYCYDRLFLRQSVVNILCVCVCCMYCIYVIHKKKGIPVLEMCLGEENKHGFNLVVCIRTVGIILTWCALGLFALYITVVFAGGKKIRETGEEIYLLQHCGNPELVLTAVRDDAEEYVLKFAPYEGTNNQKLWFKETDDGMIQVVFCEPEYALEVKVSEDFTEIAVFLKEVSEAMEQRWTKEVVKADSGYYRFDCLYGQPLCYQRVGAGITSPAIAAGSDTGGYEYVVLSRTTEDEFITHTVERYEEEFKPFEVLAKVINDWGTWSLIIFILIVLAFGGIIYSRRIIGDKNAGLFAIIFAYMLAYAALSAILVFAFVYGLQLVYGYLRMQKKQEQYEEANRVYEMLAEAEEIARASMESMERIGEMIEETIDTPQGENGEEQ